ncbi:hypothetical protein GCM10009753_62610 [Streptantibioticus ferralitis]
MDDVAVGETIRAVAAEEVMSRFRRLAAEDIVDRAGPQPLVTTADRRAEERLTEALTVLLPDSLVVGEQAAHSDPALLDRLHGRTPVWIVDPVDGTADFVRGDPHFATLVALVEDGQPSASWTYAPALA